MTMGANPIKIVSYQKENQGSQDFGKQKWVLVPAGRVELILHVQGAQAGSLHDQMLLCKTEPTDVHRGAVAGRPADDRPGHLVPPPLPLEVPHILAEARMVPLTHMGEAGVVVVLTRLPRRLCSA